MCLAVVRIEASWQDGFMGSPWRTVGPGLRSTALARLVELSEFRAAVRRPLHDPENANDDGDECDPGDEHESHNGVGGNEVPDLPDPSVIPALKAYAERNPDARSQEVGGHTRNR